MGQVPATGRSASPENIITDDSSTQHPQASLYRSEKEPSEPHDEHDALQVDATPFVNRLKKNLKGLKGWLKQNQVHAYRLYDSDLPEFAVAIDVFHAQSTHCVVQEYQAPASVNMAVAEARLTAAVGAIPEALGIEASNVHLKVRQVKSGTEQYEKLASKQSVVTNVEEGGAALEINLTDYLDTGLFLDHRPVRRYIQQNAKDKRFLNLFSYTATATVAAVRGGASSSVSVDSSRRYSEWAKRNLDNNKAASQVHEVVRHDVLGWLAAASTAMSEAGKFDLVLLDPPTFSNSTDLEDDWNVQRDHVAAIDACLSVMAPGGLIIFSNNYRRFKIVVVALAAVSAAASRSRGDGGGSSREGRIEIKNYNERLEDLQDALSFSLLDPAEQKEAEKEKKAERKAEKKASKAAAKKARKQRGSGETVLPSKKKPRLYVMDFDGDIRASEVDKLRREITAVLTSYGLAASQLDRIRDKKIPLTICVDKVAASGGYMMACVADKLVAAPFAVLGSIGVVAQIPNVHRLLKELKIDFEMLTAGKYKRTLTVFGENTDEGREKFIEDIERIHGQFKDYVSHRRPQLDIEKVATGEIWSGQDTLDLHLADKLSTSDQYLIDACEEREVLMLAFKEKKSLMSRFSAGVQSTIDGVLLKWFDRLLKSRYTIG